RRDGAEELEIFAREDAEVPSPAERHESREPPLHAEGDDELPAVRPEGGRQRGAAILDLRGERRSGERFETVGDVGVERPRRGGWMREDERSDAFLPDEHLARLHVEDLAESLRQPADELAAVEEVDHLRGERAQPTAGIIELREQRLVEPGLERALQDGDE